MPKRRFEFNIPDWHGDDEWREITAMDAEEAAEKAAEYYDDNGDQTLSRSEDNDVAIRVRDAEGVVSEWVGRAVHHVLYYADAKEKPDA